MDAHASPMKVFVRTIWIDIPPEVGRLKVSLCAVVFRISEDLLIARGRGARAYPEDLNGRARMICTLKLTSSRQVFVEQIGPPRFRTDEGSAPWKREGIERRVADEFARDGAVEP